MDTIPLDPKPPEEKTPEYSYDDLHKEPIKNIAENKELPEEKPPEPTEEEKTKAEAEAKEKADLEAKAKEKEEEVAVKPEELAEDIGKRIAEKLAPEKKVSKDKYDEFFDKVFAEKGREPNWKELSEFLENQAIERVASKQKEEAEARKKTEEDIKKANEEFTKRFNSQIDEELEELYKSGNLTAIKDPNNPSDQGVIERKALFQAMLDTNAKRVAESKDTILSLVRIFYGGYYTKPTAQPAGSEAPISMGKGTPASSEGEQEINYVKDVRRPWSFFKRPPQTS